MTVQIKHFAQITAKPSKVVEYSFKHYRVEEVSKNGSEVYVVKLKNAEPCFKSLEDVMKYFVSESQGTYQSNDDENTHATGSNDEDIYSTQSETFVIVENNFFDSAIWF